MNGRGRCTAHAVCFISCRTCGRGLVSIHIRYQLTYDYLSGLLAIPRRYHTPLVFTNTYCIHSPHHLQTYVYGFKSYLMSLRATEVPAEKRRLTRSGGDIVAGCHLGHPSCCEWHMVVPSSPCVTRVPVVGGRACGCGPSKDEWQDMDVPRHCHLIPFPTRTIRSMCARKRPGVGLVRVYVRRGARFPACRVGSRETVSRLAAVHACKQRRVEGNLLREDGCRTIALSLSAVWRGGANYIV